MAVKSQPTQDFVPLKEVRDGTVILKDGSMRMILMTSSINFALKSEDEQTALLLQFQNFLNSLEFSTQILIQSRRLDINPYISILEARRKEQLSELMKIQIDEYMQFVESFIQSANIMTKSFFIIVPYSPQGLVQTKQKITDSLFSFGKSKEKGDKEKKKSDIDVEIFEEARSQLEQRTNVIKQGLARTGVRVVPLGTEEIIELFYKTFNPTEAKNPFKDKEE